MSKPIGCNRCGAALVSEITLDELEGLVELMRKNGREKAVINWYQCHMFVVGRKLGQSGARVVEWSFWKDGGLCQDEYGEEDDSADG